MKLKSFQTPKELARRKPSKKRASYYLDTSNVEAVKRLVEAEKGLTESEIIDEAIRAYLEAIQSDPD